MPKPRVLPRPEESYILDRIPELREQFAPDVEILERIRKLRNLDWKVNVPARLEEVTGATGLEYRDATIADELLTLPTLYQEQNPSLSLTAESEGLGAEGLTTRLEQFVTAALFEDCGRRAQGPGTLARMIDATFEGGGWTQLVKEADVWAEYTKMSIDDYEDDPDDVPAPKRKTKHDKYWKASEEAKKRAGIPIRWIARDGLTLLPGYEGDVLVEMIVIEVRSLSTCLRQYGLGLDGDGNITPSRTAVRDWSKRAGSGATCELIQFWDKTWMSYLIRYTGGSSRGTSSSGDSAGTAYVIPGYTRRHGYNLGRPPFYCSLGWTKGYERARLCTWSASEPKRYAVEYISFLRTILGHLAIRDAIPPVFEESPPDAVLQIDGATGKPVGPSVYELGMRYKGGPGVRMVPLVFPNTTDKIATEIQATRQDIAALSPAGAPTGDMGGAGFALSVQHEKDRARYNQFEASIVQHLKDVATDLCKLVAGLDDTVYVASAAAEQGGHIRVQKADFDTAVRMVWTLHVDSTSAKIILQRYLQACVDSGMMSRDQAIEKLGMNVSEVRAGQAVDRIRETPAFKAAEEAEVWAAWGKGKQWEEKQKKAQDMAAAQQGPPAGGAPPGGPPMGGPGGVPNTGSLAMSPNGAGAAPGQEFQGPGGPLPGMPASPSVPTQAATAQVQSI